MNYPTFYRTLQVDGLSIFYRGKTAISRSENAVSVEGNAAAGFAAALAGTKVHLVERVSQRWTLPDGVSPDALACSYGESSAGFPPPRRRPAPECLPHFHHAQGRH